jgi:hypothetical protein
MLDFLGFLIHVVERYSYYFILFDLLLIFSRFISLTLQKYGMQWVIDHCDDAHCVRMAALRAAAELFGDILIYLY